MATLLLIDGHSQAYRAYFGVRTPLTTRHGEPTAAVYGFARKLLATIKEQKPDYFTVAFDVGETWRHAEFPDYKATRENMPDEMSTQMERIAEFLRALDIPIVTYPNYEADDVLGTLACQAAAAGDDVLIMTGDRDMFQLVNDHIRILYTSGGPKPVTSIIGVEEVRERHGVNPSQFVDYKALLGDNSDNIPGVAGVGEKTAARLLNAYGSIDDIYAHLDEVKPDRVRDALAESKTQVHRNRRLCAITCNLEALAWDPAASDRHNYKLGDVLSFFTELEFNTLIRDWPQADGGQAAAALLSPAPVGAGDAGQMTLFAFDNDEATGGPGSAQVGVASLVPMSPTGAAKYTNYTVVQDRAALDALVETLAGARSLSFDVETTSQYVMLAHLVGLGLSWAPGHAVYIPVGHTAGEQLPWEEVRTALQPFFANPDLPKLAHNGSYDLTVLLEHGMDVQGVIHDTMILAWVLEPASRMLGLKAQAATELGWHMTEISALIGSGKKQITIDQAPMDTVGAYCGADVDATIQLYPLLASRVHARGMWPVYEQIELPLLPVISAMERAGILLDVGYLAEMSERLARQLGGLARELFALVGHEFNLRSTQQMSNVLFAELNFPTERIGKTSGGQYSTAVGELEKLREKKDKLSEKQLRVLDLILEQRLLEKLRGTYVDNLPALVNPRTGRLHTSFNQAGAVTGRMSSSDPNLQNIPIRTEVGREIRRAFVAPPGWLLMSADYSQIELRVLAHVAHEESFIEAFRAGADIHAATAARLFGVPLEEVTKAQRGVGKTINFATVYGSSAFGISNRTDLDPNQAQQFLDQYFENYPRIRDYIETTIDQAKRDGFVQTMLGRKRFFPELQGSSLPYMQRQGLERQAINAPIQGTAADIMKIAMVRLHDALVAQGFKARMLLQVHDELVLEFPPQEQERLVALVCEVMENAYPLDVPLRVDVEVGPNWYDMQPVEVIRGG